MEDDEVNMDPLHVALTALAYLAWPKMDDLPDEVDAAIDSLWERIKKGDLT